MVPLIFIVESKDLLRHILSVADFPHLERALVDPEMEKPRSFCDRLGSVALETTKPPSPDNVQNRNKCA